MTDTDLLRADLVNFAPDDALCLVYLPREGDGRPHRHLRFYQISKADLWEGVGGGLEIPTYVIPPDDTESVPELPKPPPVETWSMVVQSSDGLNVRSLPSKSATKIRLVRRGVTLTVEAPTVTADGYLWHKLAGEPGYVAEGAADGKTAYLKKV